MLPPPSLAELQRSFRHAVLDGDNTLAADIIADRVPPPERLDVYRNNVLSSLTAALKESFPAVCTLVDPRFFDYAASSFLRTHPPRQPCLAEYGGDFPDLLATFPPCRALVYLPDVARLEWQAGRVARAPEAPAITPAALRLFAAAEAPHLTLRLQPALAYLSSPWPIDTIWHANRPDGDAENPIDLDSGGVYLELRRRAGAVALHRLDEAEFAFRARLAAGAALAQAAEAALAARPSFDATASLTRLFAEGSVIAVSRAQGDHEHES